MSAAAEIAEEDAARTERLLDRSLRIGYVETDERPRRDSAWTTAYILTNALLVVGGIAAFAGRDKSFFLHSSEDYLRVPGHCTAGRALLEDEEHIDSGWDVAFILVGGLVGSMVVGLLFLQLLRKAPMQTILLSSLSYGALFVIIGAAALADDEADKSMPITSIVLGAFLLLVPFLIWQRLKLISRLLSVAGDGLAANPSLLSVSISVLFVSTVCVAIQFGFVAVAMMNGKVVIDNDPASNLPCKFQTSFWAQAYMLLAALTGLWTASIGEQITIYVIGGTISQWYYAEQGASTRGATIRSLRYALRPSFGSICLGGALLVLIGIARNALQVVQRRLGVCCTFLFQMLLSWMSLFTKFTTIRMAVTGENFFAAAGQVKNLLVRNARDAYTVWWMPVFVLRVFSILAGVAWGFLWFGITKCAHFSAPMIASVAYGVLAATALLFVSDIMLSIVDTVFLCWVMDCESNKITHEHIHEVFMATPLAKPGFAVEQPDGTFGYAPPTNVTDVEASATWAHHAPASHAANHSSANV